MRIATTCIRRPVMTTLVMLSFLVIGVFGYRQLPVAALPRVDFPTISVSAQLPGASPETMASSVASVLERQFSTISGIRGRVTDYLRLPGGRWCHHLQVIGPLFQAGDWIRRFQFVQDRPDHVVLHLVPFGEPGPERLRNLEETMRGALGRDVAFELRLVARIDVGPGGKYVGVRSLVGPGPSAWQEPGPDSGRTT